MTLQKLASGPHTLLTGISEKSHCTGQIFNGLPFSIVSGSCRRTLGPGGVSNALSAVLCRQAIWRAVRSSGPHSDLPAHQRCGARGAWPHAWAEHRRHDWGAGPPFNGADGPLRLWRCR